MKLCNEEMHQLSMQELAKSCSPTVRSTLIKSKFFCVVRYATIHFDNIGNEFPSTAIPLIKLEKNAIPTTLQNFKACKLKGKQCNNLVVGDCNCCCS